jgi:type I restriction enzyme, S subunit
LYFKIPNNWTWIRLGYLGYWGAGATPSKGNVNYYLNGNIPWLVTGDLNDDYIYNIPQKITSEAVSETSVRLNPTGSILIAMYGATIGKLGILTFPATTNQACCACIPSVSINSKFLFYFLMYNRKRFVKNGEGGAQPNISKEKIVSTLMPLPPLNEQNKIVCIIERLLGPIAYYSDLYQKREKLNSELYDKIKKSILNDAVRGNLIVQEGYDEPSEKLLQPVGYNKTSYTKLEKKAKDLLTNSCIFVSDNSYYEMRGCKKHCIDNELLFKIPCNWSWARLGSITKLTIGKTPDRSDHRYWENGKYNWVSISDMKDFGHVANTKEKISEFAAKTLWNYNISLKGSLIMSFKLTIGRTSILDVNAFHNEAIVTINSLKNDDSFKNYLFYVLPLLTSNVKTKNAIKGNTLNMGSLSSILIPVPPIEEQIMIVKKIKDVFEIVNTSLIMRR